MTRRPSRHAGVPPVTGQVSGEGGDERRRHRALGEQIPDQVGDAEGDVEGVHLIARAEEPGVDDVPGQTQDAAHHRGD